MTSVNSSEDQSQHERRFASVAHAFEEGRAGKGDLMAAMRHLLRWEYERGGRPNRLVPSSRPWPSIEEWLDGGFRDVFDYDESQRQVHAAPWHPDWLDQVGEMTIEGPLVREDVRRHISCTETDPFLGQVGFSSYRSLGQREAVRSVLTSPAGSTLTVLLPTGGGKSLCAHLPALLDEGAVASLVLTIVPTVALALDQQERLKSIIPHPTAYVGGSTQEERQINRAIRRRIREGRQRILFTSPESVLQSLASSLYYAAERGLLKLFVIDEAHMVEHWGDEFRSAFQEITAIRTDLLRRASDKPFRTLLLTATLTESALDSLQTLFGEPGPFALVSAVQLRPEPAFWTSYCPSDEVKSSRLLESLRYLPRPLILYTTLVSDAKRWYGLLRACGYLRTGLMTGETGRSERLDLLALWRTDELDVMVATSAFGLGVDKNDVRVVIHACVPENLDRYYQEVGRGGRDGLASASLVLYTAADLKWAKNARKLISLELGQERWKAMVLNWEPLGDGRYRVPVDVAPAYNPNVQSDYNVDWNLRTLTLMARARVIALDSEAPPTVNADPEMSESQIATDYADSLRAYRNHRIVRPLIDDHQSEEVWSTRVGPLRDGTYAAAGRSFQLMRAMLHGKRDVAEEIAELYRIPASGTRRGVNVAESCGGCRACRENGIAPYETDAAAPWSAWKARDEVGEVLASEFGAQTVLALFHTGFEEQRKERRLGQFIEWLAHQGIRNIVCPPVLHEPIRHRLRRFATPVFLFARYEPLYLQPFATLVIVTDQLQTGDLREVLHAQRNRVLLLPDSVRDPDAPHRRLQDVLSCRTYVFDDFLTRIGI